MKILKVKLSSLLLWLVLFTPAMVHADRDADLQAANSVQYIRSQLNSTFDGQTLNGNWQNAYKLACERVINSLDPLVKKRNAYFTGNPIRQQMRSLQDAQMQFMDRTVTNLQNFTQSRQQLNAMSAEERARPENLNAINTAYELRGQINRDQAIINDITTRLRILAPCVLKLESLLSQTRNNPDNGWKTVVENFDPVTISIDEYNHKMIGRILSERERNALIDRQAQLFIDSMRIHDETPNNTAALNAIKTEMQQIQRRLDQGVAVHR